MPSDHAPPETQNTPWLPWRTRATTLSLARAFAIAAAIALATGLGYWLLPATLNWHAAQVALVAHLAVGLVSVLLFVPFLVAHYQDGREPWRNLVAPWRLFRRAERANEWYRQRLIGHGLTWLVVLALGSGLVLSWPALPYLLTGQGETLPYGLHLPLGWLHLASPLAALPFVVAHFRKTKADRLKNARSDGAGRPAAYALAAGSLVVAALVAVLPPPPALAVDLSTSQPFYSLPFGKNPFFPAELKTPDGGLVNWRGVPGSMQCVGCHRKEFVEWNSSIHAVSDRDLIYDTTVQENVTASKAGAHLGEEKGRWCESCHNPLGTLTGAVTPIVASQETEAVEEGVSCIVCHTADHAVPLAGNGAFTSRINAVPRHLDPSLIMAAPARHAKDMQAKRDLPLMGDSALCGTCHTEIRPIQVAGSHPVNLQDTYDEWRRSTYAERNIHCQDCHMAADPPAVVAAIKRGETPARRVSHRFIGNNYLLADPRLPDGLVHALRGGKPTGLFQVYDKAGFERELAEQHRLTVGLLREAAALEVSARPAGRELAVDVAVKNVGAGHALPTGPLDQRYMWLEVEVKDAAGRTVFRQGAFDGVKGEEDPKAVKWFKRLWDAEGKPITRHILFDVERSEFTRRPIAAGGEDRVGYRVPLPAGASGPFQVEARLWYRIALQDIVKNIENQTGEKVAAVIPPLEIAAASARTAAGLAVAQLAPRGGRP